MAADTTSSWAAVDGIKAGWNEVNFPISLLTLRYSTDENAKLDLDQIDRLWIGAGRQGASYKSQEFDLYFDSLSIVTQETNTNVEYTKIRPGKYKVHVRSRFTHLPGPVRVLPSQLGGTSQRQDGSLPTRLPGSERLLSGSRGIRRHPGVRHFTAEDRRKRHHRSDHVHPCARSVSSLLVRRWQQKRTAKNNPSNHRSPHRT